MIFLQIPGASRVDIVPDRSKERRRKWKVALCNYTTVILCLIKFHFVCHFPTSLLEECGKFSPSFHVSSCDEDDHFSLHIIKVGELEATQHCLAFYWLQSWSEQAADGRLIEQEGVFSGVLSLDFLLTVPLILRGSVVQCQRKKGGKFSHNEKAFGRLIGRWTTAAEEKKKSKLDENQLGV